MIILVPIGCYLPGYKAGGPVRTLANMVDHLGDEFKFKILTADRDLGDTTSYSDIIIECWNSIGKADVFYMSQKRRSFRIFKRFFCSIEYDIIYLNSFFSPQFSIKSLLLRRFCLIPDRPLIIAPRGQLTSGSLNLKRLKKFTYIYLAKLLRLYRGAIWQASSEHEAADIRCLFGENVQIVIAPNLPTSIHLKDESMLMNIKTNGNLKVLFLSRISRVKNLHFALNLINGIKGKIELNIYGPIEDNSYWTECQKVITSLPENITVEYKGGIEYNNILNILMKHDLFFLPTLGENFGHVILEALCAGCPVLISDQTPWRGLSEKRAGWDLPLSKPSLFNEVLQKCADMDQEEYSTWSKQARKYGITYSENQEIIELNKKLFLTALNSEH